VLGLKVVQMLGQLPVHVIRQHAHAREQRAQDRQLLLQQLHLLLQPVIFARQYLHPLLRLAAAHFRLLSRLAHRHVVALAAAAILVRGLVAAGLLLGEILWLLREGLEGGKGAAHAVGEGGGRAGHLLLLLWVVGGEVVGRGVVGGGGDDPRGRSRRGGRGRAWRLVRMSFQTPALAAPVSPEDRGYDS